MDRLSAPGTSRAAHPVHHSAPSRRTTPMPITVKALQKTGPDQPFRVATIERRDPRPDDVVIDIRAAGICHSDIHTIRNEWGEAHFPLRSEEHTSELQSRGHLVCRLLLEKKDE